ncbi:MAG: tRNA (adenosine(37)-N6)-threonylcarbamoyltransferase complex ATPase subunit type 1 TsaE [Bacteroidales bacterium]|jgi:tRNA threonylcarbamoyladenosine biosynthesis protein TsaE|nr:tRNA (adenosine(37)-N6)-threonylcarbamoyltransferase complex ATPase subunit type 1 TsaE [Bacteroidales bacterium]MDD4702812.1 tRNA (adenosine(37)-N6)-threonylcarbamoyltransferase complex ATPase subunit type 1 TsaE [Bacteroidales bacterium]MDX9797285.1 tRNA (adenosine(37)-N6)-threonylcarbamoyltransferase complex ATPase subunit type 1 TsaE [Bacteroidales bacterium]
MQPTYIADSLSDLKTIANKILEDNSEDKIFILEGEMGAGKTTLTKYLCENLGATDNVCSPTFAIVNQYYSDIIGDIYHFDFYRINKEQEAFDIGFEEYLYSGNYCFIEWAEKVSSLLPLHYTIISIKEIQEKRREISIRKV